MPRQTKDKLALYQRVLVEEFMREFRFHIEVSASRAAPRPGFIGKLANKGDTFFSILNLTLKSALIVSPEKAVLGVALLVEEITAFMVSQAGKRIDTGPSMSSGTMRHADLAILELLLEQTARLASRRYEAFIVKKLTNIPEEGVIPFAETGARRMLEYLLRLSECSQDKKIPESTRSKLCKLEVSPALLLRGLIEGRSGKLVEGNRNTRLLSIANESQIWRYSAEGAYGRSAFRIAPDDTTYTRAHPKHADRSVLKSIKSRDKQTIVKKLFDYGRVKTISGGEPKYGCIFVNKEDLDHYGYKKNDFEAGIKERLSYEPTWAVVTKEKVREYMESQKNKPTKGTLRFIDFVGKIAICSDDLSNIEMKGGDFSLVDFTGATLPADISQAKFHNAILARVNLEGVTNAEGADFSHADLSFCRAKDANLSGANFTDAKCSYGNFTEADLSDITHLNTDWRGVTLEGTKNGTNFTKIRIEQEEQYESHLAAIETKLKFLLGAGGIEVGNAGLTEEEQQEEWFDNVTEVIASTTNDKDKEEFKKLRAKVEQLAQSQQVRRKQMAYLTAEIEASTERENELSHDLKEKYALLNEMQTRQNTFDERLKDLTSTQNAVLARMEQVELKTALINSLETLTSSLQSQQEAIVNRLRKLEEKFNQVSGEVGILKKDFKGIKNKLMHLTTPIEPLSAKTINDFKVKLHAYYQEQAVIERVLDEGKTFPIEQTYINLAIVEEKEQKKAAAKDEGGSTVTSLRDERINSYEDIYGMKKAIELKKLFDPRKKEDGSTSKPNKLLILGRAGIGKTTLCKYIIHEWMHNHLWQGRYDWVFWIPLRHLAKFPDVYTIENLLFREFKCQFRSLNIKKPRQVVTFWDGLDPNKVLFLLDGYDEATGANQELLNELLDQPHFILTSRPYDIFAVQQKVDLRLENLGFVDKDIDSFVTQYFSLMKLDEADATEKAKALTDYIHTNPGIKGAAHIPINLQFISQIWAEKSTDNPFPNKMVITELYEQMIIKLGIRYLERRDEVDGHTQRIVEKKVYNTNDVRRECGLQLEQLGEIALKGLDSPSIIIEKESMKQFCEEDLGIGMEDIKSLVKFGVIKPTVDGEDTRNNPTNRDYYFIHLTFQEYLAAHYIATRYMSVNKHKRTEAIELVLQHKYDPKYQIVMWFISGILRNHPDGLNHYFDTLLSPPRDMAGMYETTLLMNCLNECRLSDALKNKNALLGYFSDWLQRSVESRLARNKRPVLKWIGKKVRGYEEIFLKNSLSNTLEPETYRQTILTALNQSPLVFDEAHLFERMIEHYQRSENSEIKVPLIHAFSNLPSLLPRDSPYCSTP